MAINKKIENKLYTINPTETLLRKWQRRLIVALTDEEKKRCKDNIKKYGG